MAWASQPTWSYYRQETRTPAAISLRIFSILPLKIVLPNPFCTELKIWWNSFALPLGQHFFLVFDWSFDFISFY